MVKLNEFSKDQLQWMLNKATQDMVDITNYIEGVETYNLQALLAETVAEKMKQFDSLQQICTQVLTAIGDVAIRETIISN
jgi:hypothetical protein